MRRLLLLGAGLLLALHAPAQTNPVTVYGKTADDGTVTLFATSSHVIPVYLRVDLPLLQNLRADVDLPFGVQLDPGQTGVRLFRLTPTSTGRLAYSISYTTARGNPFTVHHDDAHGYLLPFDHGRKFRLSQGFGGGFSHSGENEYAVDFEMEIGTQVHAARGGTVAEVKADSASGGTSAAYARQANYILVMHDDGSFGNYVHLRPGGAVVRPGDRVEAGQIIGYSGNTGQSTGPHLHFDVRVPETDGTMRSIPFRFAGRDGTLVSPEEDRFYYARHPGGPDFEESYGAELTLADFADYVRPYHGSGVDVRIEQVDYTFLVFLQNGLDREATVHLTLDLRGLDSDAGTQLSRPVPARSEVLATILRAVPGAPRIQYGARVRYDR